MVRGLIAVASLCALAACKTTTRPVQGPKADPSRMVVLEKGDTLYSIAKRWKTTAQAIQAENGISDVTSLQIGQVLKMPPEAVRPADEPTPELPPDADPLVRPPPSALSACGDLPRGGAPTAQSPFIWPVEGVVVAKFGNQDGERHDGIDIAAPRGTPIWAAAEGTVILSGEQEGYGRIVAVQHTEDRVTLYAHNAKNCVSDGTKVAVGEVLGLVGTSGGLASPRVHFEVRISQKPVNPRRFLP